MPLVDVSAFPDPRMPIGIELKAARTADARS
jgi:hypothetical protein